MTRVLFQIYEINLQLTQSQVTFTIKSHAYASSLQAPQGNLRDLISKHSTRLKSAQIHKIPGFGFIGIFLWFLLLLSNSNMIDKQVFFSVNIHQHMNEMNMCCLLKASVDFCLLYDRHDHFIHMIKYLTI